MIEFTDAEIKEDLWAWNDFQDRSELTAAADFEKQCATDRIMQLSRIEAAASDHS